MLAKVCDDDNGQLTSFSVTQGNEKYGNGKVSIAVAVYGYVIYIQQKVPWKVDEELLNLPLYLDNGRLRVTQEGRNIIIRTDFGLTVLYDTVYYVEVVVPSTDQGKMCGLCGNYNKNNGDDFRRPGGRKTTSVDDFVKSWVVDMPGNVCGGQCPVCEQAKATLYGKSDSCGFMSAPDGVLKPATVRLTQWHMCPIAFLMFVLWVATKMTYATESRPTLWPARVKIQPWRSSSFCRDCFRPQTSYEVCADTCGGTCASFIYPFTCSESCFEGCQCDAGLVFDGIQCVPLDSCGCVHNGRYPTVGQAVVDNTGTSKCVCQASGVVNCEKLTCASGEVCGGRDGVGGCHVKQGHCSVSQVGLLTSFDGMSGAIGAQGETAVTVNSQHVTW
ncbi:hypothetical protein CgunFtcFv8_004498 [Champsocephalus gunnari]|uniref:VWFD domain-containing protein n=1 Tax=Champsocephalus gunnari TaxID=52237 RepID=A0AAN8E5B3_CHAGU|nr:hypothetical protein CgunFtcFv8_004498 [Champsocephalus gunnari]